MKKVFYETQKYGKLYIDKILFETYLPILFTCKNDMNDIFICVCCQDNENGKKWLISETDGKVMVELLQNKLSIREAFLKNVGLKLSIFFDGQNYREEYDNSDWTPDSIYLPKPDSYIDAEDDEYAEEIEYFMSWHKIEYNSSVNIKCDKILNPVQLSNDLFIDDILMDITDNVGNGVDSILMKTLKCIENIKFDFNNCLETEIVTEKYERNPNDWVEQSLEGVQEISVNVSENDNLSMAA
jgi:hypothetical protein